MTIYLNSIALHRVLRFMYELVLVRDHFVDSVRIKICLSLNIVVSGCQCLTA